MGNEPLRPAGAGGRTAARLRTPGLPTRGIAALHVRELLPMALAAASGGVALGLALPALLGPALTLRRFTGGPAAPALHTDYALTAALGLGLAVLVAAAVAVETWLGRRRGLGAVLRLGEAARAGGRAAVSVSAAISVSASVRAHVRASASVRVRLPACVPGRPSAHVPLTELADLQARALARSRRPSRRRG